VFDYPLLRRYVFQSILVACLLSGRAACAQSCIIYGPHYNLTADTVDWSMKIGSGRSCVHGVRFGNVDVESVQLVSPPQSGQVVLLQGPGFRYDAKADFGGQDSFSLAVFGTINNIRGSARGSSTIHVTISITGPPRTSAPPDTARPPYLHEHEGTGNGRPLKVPTLPGDITTVASIRGLPGFPIEIFTWRLSSGAAPQR
jgi:hypothetical protein